MSHLIYIADHSEERAEQIEERLLDNGHQVEIVSTYDDLISEISIKIPDLLIINHTILNTIEYSNELFNNSPALVYVSNIESEQKLNYYHNGVSRVITVFDNNLDPVIASSKMLLFRHYYLRDIKQKTLSYGTLQSFPLSEILRNALFEKKNLVINLENKDWYAKFRIFQGHLVKADSTSLSGEEAILKALYLKYGNFKIISYEKDKEYSPVSTSLLGILAQSQFEQNEIHQFLVELGNKNPRFQSTVNNSLGITEDEKTILEVINNYNDFQELIVFSPFPARKTIRVLKDLVQKSIILSEGEGKEFATFEQSDLDNFATQFFPEDVREGKLLVLGLPGSGKSEIIRKIAGREQSKIKSIQSLDFTRVRIKNNRALTVFGISIEEDFQPILDKISEGMVAFIFLVDYERQDAFEYSKYLLQLMISNYGIPFIIGLTNGGDNDESASQIIRNKLDVPEEIGVIPVDVNSVFDLRSLLFKCNTTKESVVEEEV